MFSILKVLSFIGVASAAVLPVAERATGNGTWNGSGNIRTLHDSDGTDLGCLNVDGFWTVDESQCAEFTAVASLACATCTTQYTIVSSSAGYCGIQDNEGGYKCYSDAPAQNWTLITLQPYLGTWIFIGDLQGDMATAPGASNPPVGTEAEQVHQYTGEDTGDYVVFTWKAL